MFNNSPEFMNGYTQGELERQALATANSELRSQVLELEQQVKDLTQRLRTANNFRRF